MVDRVNGQPEDQIRRVNSAPQPHNVPRANVGGNEDGARLEGANQGVIDARAVALQGNVVRVEEQDAAQVNVLSMSELSHGFMQRSIEDNGLVGEYANTAANETLALRDRINSFIIQNYEGVYEKAVLGSENVNVEELEREYQTHLERISKSQKQQAEEGRANFLRIAELQNELEEEADLSNKLNIKLDILKQRFLGLRAVALAKAHSELERNMAETDTDLSYEVSIGALLKSEKKAIQDRHPEGEALSLVEQTYMNTLDAKLLEHEARLKDKEVSGERVGLSDKIMAAYNLGKEAFEDEMNIIELKLDEEIEGRPLGDSLHQEKDNNNSVELESTVEIQGDKETVRDNVSAKYSNLLRLQYSSIRHFEVAGMYLDHMNTDITGFTGRKILELKTKKDEYKQEETRVCQSKEQIDNNAELSEAEKTRQKKDIDTQSSLKTIKKQIDDLNAIIKKMSVYLIYYKRLMILKEYFVNHCTGGIFADRYKYFDNKPICFDNFNVNEISSNEFKKILFDLQRVAR